MDTPHEFVFMYQNPNLIGTYTRNGHGRIKEVAVKAPHMFLWDQWTPYKFGKREHFDIVFNPKFSVPFLTDCPGVFVSHGCDWCVISLGEPLSDRLNQRYLVPRYTHKASATIAVSNTTRDHVIQFLKMPPENVYTIYHGIDEPVREKLPEDTLQEIRQRYQLPDKYVLYCGQIYPSKNFGRLIQAYAKIGPRLGIPLVVAGKVTKEHQQDCDPQVALIDTLGISKWVLRPGWVGRQDLPGLYQMAEALLFPSLYESFGMPIPEAMASGCPVVTSNRYGTEEIAGGAAVLVDPEDVESIAGGIELILTDSERRQRLITAGYERSRVFSWRKCAEQTLEVLVRVASQRRLAGRQVSGRLTDSLHQKYLMPAHRLLHRQRFRQQSASAPDTRSRGNP